MNITDPFWRIIRANYTDREYDRLFLMAGMMDGVKYDDSRDSQARACAEHGAWCADPTNPACACDACEDCSAWPHARQAFPLQNRDPGDENDNFPPHSDSRKV